VTRATAEAASPDNRSQMDTSKNRVFCAG
jgi:hypothetical protein